MEPTPDLVASVLDDFQSVISLSELEHVYKRDRTPFYQEIARSSTALSFLLKDYRDFHSGRKRRYRDDAEILQAISSAAGAMNITPGYRAILDNVPFEDPRARLTLIPVPSNTTLFDGVNGLKNFCYSLINTGQFDPDTVFERLPRSAALTVGRSRLFSASHKVLDGVGVVSLDVV